MTLFDTHCHLFDDKFSEDLASVVERARAAGVRRMVVPGVDVDTSRRAIELADRYPEVYAAVGIHPESLADWDAAVLAEIEALTAHPKVVAIGEIGLDYYWDVAPRLVQQEVFVRQLELARNVGLPVIIHNRDATEDTVRLIETRANGVTGVMHCFTGSIETARRCIRRGFFISYGGPVTFKNAENVRKAAREIPDEWLVVETDAPYLSPHPYRGQRNEPARVAQVVEVLAETRGQTLEELARLTYDNAHRLFPRVEAGGSR
ncbi:putative metal-dependent hydrolase YabD [Alicyclobacillus contaminans]|uniref:TatD family hydrolase n=1 Tax=Alicyclobacillus contaminans TaxID=392016 RepID=UPI000402CE3B|nr:TatD family hydrolase [Alicyclobacillus contaminans]GMA50552.1 putative metal-dependent hydrolase YabD [Alicyclobacillus contaminans]